MDNFLSARQFQTLSALCDTLVPALERKPDPYGFWGRPASALDVPRLVAETVHNLQGEAEQKDFLRVLDLLSQPLPALLLTGHARPFSELSFAEREQVLKNWSTSAIPDLRKAFQALKRLTCVIFYARPDETGRNPNWPAIGYPGPLASGLPKPPKKIQPLDRASLHDLHCDVVVVGSGAGGGVVAGELARAGLSVIVIEKGGYFAEQDFDGQEYAGYQNLYENQAVLASQDLGVLVLAGATLGGGTVVNWDASFRTPDYVLEEWQKDYGLEGITGPAYQAALDAVSARIHVTMDESWPSPEAQAIERGCQELGLPCGVIPRNVRGCGECGWCGFGCSAGAKQSTLKTYLQDAAECGARFLVNAECRRVLIEHGQAVGVEVEASGQTWQVRARFVVVAAGTLHTPAVLLRSGLTNRNIGRNLRLHPVAAVFGAYPELIETWRGVMMSRYSSAFNNLDGKHYGVMLEHPPAHAGIVALGLPWLSGAQHKERMTQTAHTANIIVLTRDHDSGRITLDNHGRPLIHYRISAYDGRHLLRGIREAYRVHLAAGAQEVGSTFSGLEMLNAGGDLEAHLRQIERIGLAPNRALLFSAHQMGSCRMAGSPENGALRPSGESWEVKNLFVADGSTFPTASGVNPMLTIMAIAYQVSQHIKAASSIPAQALDK